MTEKVPTRDEEPLQLTGKVIYIIGPRRFQNELMVFFLQRKTGAKCIGREDLRHLSTIDANNIRQPKLILLDCGQRDFDSYIPELESSGGNILYQDLVALFNVSPGLGIEEKALKKGVRGFFYEQDPLDRYTKGILAIFDGELWAKRGVMAKTILENRDRDIVSRKDTTLLTPREIEIVSMITLGVKNEQIANELFISRNTVRTHIYNIFKKINVPNRLQAALWAVKNL